MKEIKQCYAIMAGIVVSGIFLRNMEDIYLKTLIVDSMLILASIYIGYIGFRLIAQELNLNIVSKVMSKISATSPNNVKERISFKNGINVSIVAKSK